MLQQPDAGGSADGDDVPQPRSGKILLHLGGNPIQHFEPFFFLRAGRETRPLCVTQFRPKSRHVFLFPGIQNALGQQGGVRSEIVHTLFTYRPRFAVFLKNREFSRQMLR